MIKFKIIKPALENKKAYTLIELSIAILIISLLMAGVFSFATGSINDAKSALTTQRMEEIYKSMGTYLMVNKRLPCPASIKTSKINDILYGQEVSGANGCEGEGVYKSLTHANLFFGGVPIKALNLSSEYAEDGYGNKFNYIIDRRFTYGFITTGSTIENIASSFGTVAPYNIIAVKEKQFNGTSLELTSDAIFVLSSAGANGLGAFNAESAIQNNSPTDVEEIDNRITGLNDSISPPTATFDNIFFINSYGSENFDDILFYKARINFLSDFSAENLIYCKGFDISDTSFTKRNLYYGQYLYANSACTNNGEIIKIKKCGNGGWSPIVENCPTTSP